MANHSFNLVTEPWVPVLANGKHESYSLETLFDQPTSIRQLDIADPLERVSIMRLLLAIVLREGTPSFRTVGNHAGLFWFSMYRFNVSTGAPPAVPA